MSAFRFVPALLLGNVLLLLSGCRTTPELLPEPHGLAAEVARTKFEKLSQNRVQLWVVLHVRAHKTLKPDGTVDEAALLAGTLADAEAAVRGGADMLVLINARCAMPLYERVIAAVRARHPTVPLGISALSYSPANLSEGLRLVKKHAAQMVWCEVVPGEEYEYEADDGRYLRAKATPRAWALQQQALLAPDALHTAGVHMKYTRPIDGQSFEAAMKSALGSVDGINITGPKTAQLADVERIRKARELAGEYPLGLASGVSIENIAEVMPFIDYAIVGTSLKKSDDPLRIDETKVRALREKMTSLGGGRRSYGGAVPR